jgi:hypothetical protein
MLSLFIYAIATKANFLLTYQYLTAIDNAFIIEFMNPEDEAHKEHRIFVSTTAKDRDEWIKLINSR